MTMNPEFESRIEKYFEGTSLGLAAVADVLEKMDNRFEKADLEDAEAIQKEEYAAERTALIKDVITEIMKANGQADNDLGLSTSDKPVGGTPTTANDKSAGDESETVGEKNPTETAGQPIQAEEEKVEKNFPDEVDEDDESSEDEEDGEDSVEKMFENIEKQIASLRLALGKGEDEDDESEDMEDYPNDEEDEKVEQTFDERISKSLGTDAADIMSKLGIKKSTSTAVRRVAVSPEVSPSEAFITKSEDGETAVDFTKLSYSELRRLEDGIRNGTITEIEL